MVRWDHLYEVSWPGYLWVLDPVRKTPRFLTDVVGACESLLGCDRVFVAVCLLAICLCSSLRPFLRFCPQAIMAFALKDLQKGSRELHGVISRGQRKRRSFPLSPPLPHCATPFTSVFSSRRAFVSKESCGQERVDLSPTKVSFASVDLRRPFCRRWWFRQKIVEKGTDFSHRIS